LYEDTLKQKQAAYRFSFADSVHRKGAVNVSWLEDTWYSLVIQAGVFRDILGKSNDSIQYNFRTNTVEDYGNLNILLTGLDPKQKYLMSLLNPDGSVLKDTMITGVDSSSVVYARLNANDYGLKIIKDRNGNGKWDSGSYIYKRQPEKVYVHPAPIDLKPNWDLKVEIEMKD
jgi:hypothetical protein